MKRKGKRVLAILLTVMMAVTMLPMEAFAQYQPNGWCGNIYWSGHGSLYGHYATTNSREPVYSRGILCLEPSKGALPEDFSYGDVERIVSGSDPWLARIGYYASQWAASYGYDMYHALPAWAVGTGLAYDVVEGRAPNWGTVEAVYDSSVSTSYYTEARNWIVTRLEHFEDMPGSLYSDSNSAVASPIVMTKQSDGSFAATLPNDVVWVPDEEWHGLTGFEGTSGTVSVSGATMNWSRNGGTMTFSISADQAKVWQANGGNSGALAFTKRMGGGSSNYYEVWKSTSAAQQQMLYAPSAVCAPMTGYIAFFAEMEPAHAYFTKTIEVDSSLTQICPQYYSLDGTEITVYNQDLSVHSVLTIKDGKTNTIDLEPGTYYYAETKAASGYALKEGRTSFTVASGETFTANIQNKPLFDPLTVFLKKVGEVEGEANTPIKGAQFTVAYYTTIVSDVNNTALLNGLSPVRTWIFETDASGEASFDNAHKVGGDALFTDSNGRVVGLPGTYLFTETKVPENFVACEPFMQTLTVDGIRDGNQSQWNTKTIAEENEEGYFYATKVIADNESLTSICPDYYSMDGAEITIYYAGNGKVAATLSITDGKTPVIKLNAGDYYAKETVAPEHYNIDPNTYNFSVTAANDENHPATIQVKDSPRFDNLTILLKKIGKVAGEDDKPLPGAVFKVSYYTELNSVEGRVVRTWYFMTDANGEVKYDNDHLADGYSSDDLFVKADGTIVGLPGTYKFEEVSAPIGYTLTDIFIRVIDPDRQSFGSRVSVFEAATVTDEPQKIYIKIKKVDEEGNPVAPTYGSYEGAIFNVLGFDLVHNQYVVVGTITTDANGEGSFQVPNPVSDKGPFYTTYYVQEIQASPGCLLNPELHPVNPGISTADIPEIVHNMDVEEPEITVTIRKIGFNEVGLEIDLVGAMLELRKDDQTTVVESWVSDGNLMIFDGLPYGEYYIFETETPEGNLPMVEPVKIVVEETDIIQNFNIVNERIPSIATTAMYETGSKMAASDEDLKVVDLVELEGLIAGKEYILKATLVDAENEEAVAFGEKSFIAEAWTDVQSVELTFDGSEYENHTFVVFEELYEASRGLDTPLSEHKDLTDENQTVYVPKIRTTACDAADEDKVVSSVGTQIIVDQISYENMIPGTELTIYATLINKESGEVIFDKDGNTIGAVKTFVPEEASGIVSIEIEVDGSLLPGKVVVFEDMYEGEVLIARHHDREDEDQTAYVPSISTTAEDPATESQIIAYGEAINMVDHLKYENLNPETLYAVTTSIMVKSSNEPLTIDGKAVEKTSFFVTPEAEEGEFTVSGIHDVYMTFDYTDAIEGEDLVVFESIKAVSTGIIEAEHKDIEDLGQTVKVPGIGTLAVDSETGNHVSFADNSVSITDTIEYHNLIADGETEYQVEGILMDKESGERILNNEGNEVTASGSFIPVESDGTVILTFEFSYEGHDGETIVVFERVLYGDVVIAVHEKLDSEEQAIYFPKIGTSAVSSNGTDTIMATEDVTIIDTVTYENLEAGKYTMEGELMVKGIDQEGNVIATATGITASTEFEVEEAGSGSVDVVFTFDASKYDGEDLVAYETLVTYETGAVIAIHRDPSDEEQDIHFPKIRTTAMDQDTGTHMVPADHDVVIVDRVYLDSGLVEGREYTIHGILMDKGTSEPLKVNDKEVTAEVTFKYFPEMEYIDLSFSLNTKDLAGKVLVAFETLEYQENVVAIHHDVESKDQTITVPELKTTATVDGSKTFEKDEEAIVITDLVEYYGLEAGEYKLVAVVMDKTTNQPMKKITEVVETLDNGAKIKKEIIELATNELVFTVTEAEGKVSIEIPVSLKDWKGEDLVVFEKLYLVRTEVDEDGNEITVEYEVGHHEDLKDKKQTVSTAIDTGINTYLGVFALSSLVSLILAGAIILAKKKKKGSDE